MKFGGIRLFRSMNPSEKLIWITSACVAFAVICLSLIRLDEIVRSHGELHPRAANQIVQNLEGGVLSVIGVTEGDTVKRGQILAELNDQEYQTRISKLEAKSAKLQLEKARLEAEQNDESELIVAEALRLNFPEHFAAEQTRLASRRAEYQAALDGQTVRVQEVTKQLSMVENLVKRKAAAEVELIETLKELNNARQKLESTRTQRAREISDEYSEALAKLEDTNHELDLSKNQQQRTKLRSQIDGVITKIFVDEVGGVIKPGQEIIRITPTSDIYVAEVKVEPKDISRVYLGQKAVIKVSAYDYSVYGTLSGSVEFVSADVLEESERGGVVSYYTVRVGIDPNGATGRKSVMTLRPGMTADVEFLGNKRSILQYLLAPLSALNTAFQEP